MTVVKNRRNGTRWNDRSWLLAFLKDSMMTRGDKYKMAICNHSGTIAIYDKETNNFFSPLIDGPIEAKIEGKDIIKTTKITKYGKQFSIS